MASRNQRLALAIILGSSGLVTLFASCTDSYRNSLSGGASGATGGGGASSGTDSSGTLPPGVNCKYDCSNDLKSVIDCMGRIVSTCTADQGCYNAGCIDNPCEAAEKSKSSYGCDYWALKTAQRPQADGACFAAVVANTWEKPIHINVEHDGQIFDPKNFAYIPDATVTPDKWSAYDPTTGLDVGQVAILFLSRSAGGLIACPRQPAVTDETGVIGTGLGKAFHITTDYPAVAYQIAPYGGGMTSYSSATLLLPTSAWDTDYVAVNGYTLGTPVTGADPSLNILAYKDGTVVTIRPNADIVAGTGVEGAAKGTPKNYTLNKGEFLQIAQPAQLAGSPIKSNMDHPIAVIGAHTCMFVPDFTQKDCDSGQQQIAPVRALGNEYVAIRYKNRVMGQEESPPWRMVGAVDGTTLTWEGPGAPTSSPMTLNSGEIVEFSAPGPFVVKSQDAEHPFYLGGFMTGSSLYGGVGDPEWINVTPPPQYLNRYVFFTDPTYPETSLTVVRTPSKIDGSFADVELKCLGKLDGWQKIGNYEYTHVDIMTGDFKGNGSCTNGRQEMTSDLPFGVNVWGWGTTLQTKQVSYAYPAGAGFQPINNVVITPD